MAGEAWQMNSIAFVGPDLDFTFLCMIIRINNDYLLPPD